MQRLPDSTSSLIRADIQFTDYSAAVWELIANAIDAAATCISVDVNPSVGYARVEDNGDGIPYSSLQRLGMRSSSSKAGSHTLGALGRTYGSKGESLANLRLLCQLQLTSRAAQQFETYTLTLCSPNQQQPAGPKPCAARARHGTTITMSSFLLQQPVRQRALQQNAGSCLSSLVALLTQRLAGHQQVECRVTTSGGQQVLLHLPKGRNLADLCQLLCSPLLDQLQPLCPVSSSSYSLTGCITHLAAPQSSSCHQLVYVNERQVTCPQVSGFLASWLQRQLHQQPAGSSTLVSRSARKPVPGFLLLLQAPDSSLVANRQAAGVVEVVWQDWPTVSCLLANAAAAVWGRVPAGLCPAASEPSRQRHSGSRNLSMPANARGSDRTVHPAPLAAAQTATAPHAAADTQDGIASMQPNRQQYLHKSSTQQPAAGGLVGASGSSAGGSRALLLSLSGITSRTRTLGGSAAAMKTQLQQPQEDFPEQELLRQQGVQPVQQPAARSDTSRAANTTTRCMAGPSTARRQQQDLAPSCHSRGATKPGSQQGQALLDDSSKLPQLPQSQQLLHTRHNIVLLSDPSHYRDNQNQQCMQYSFHHSGSEHADAPGWGSWQDPGNGELDQMLCQDNAAGIEQPWPQLQQLQHHQGDDFGSDWLSDTTHHDMTAAQLHKHQHQPKQHSMALGVDWQSDPHQAEQAAHDERHQLQQPVPQAEDDLSRMQQLQGDQAGSGRALTDTWMDSPLPQLVSQPRGRSCRQAGLPSQEPDGPFQGHSSTWLLEQLLQQDTAELHKLEQQLTQPHALQQQQHVKEEQELEQPWLDCSIQQGQRDLWGDLEATWEHERHSGQTSSADQQQHQLLASCQQDQDERFADAKLPAHAGSHHADLQLDVPADLMQELQQLSGQLPPARHQLQGPVEEQQFNYEYQQQQQFSNQQLFVSRGRLKQQAAHKQRTATATISHQEHADALYALHHQQQQPHLLHTAARVYEPEAAQGWQNSPQQQNPGQPWLDDLGSPFADLLGPGHLSSAAAAQAGMGPSPMLVRPAAPAACGAPGAARGQARKPPAAQTSFLQAWGLTASSPPADSPAVAASSPIRRKGCALFRDSSSDANAMLRGNHGDSPCSSCSSVAGGQCAAAGAAATNSSGPTGQRLVAAAVAEQIAAARLSSAGGAGAAIKPADAAAASKAAPVQTSAAGGAGLDVREPRVSAGSPATAVAASAAGTTAAAPGAAATKPPGAAAPSPPPLPADSTPTSLPQASPAQPQAYKPQQGVRAPAMAEAPPASTAAPAPPAVQQLGNSTLDLQATAGAAAAAVAPSAAAPAGINQPPEPQQPRPPEAPEQRQQVRGAQGAVSGGRKAAAPLAPFAERLVQSAPPQAKRRRRFVADGAPLPCAGLAARGNSRAAAEPPSRGMGKQSSCLPAGEQQLNAGPSKHSTHLHQQQRKQLQPQQQGQLKQLYAHWQQQQQGAHAPCRYRAWSGGAAASELETEEWHGIHRSHAQGSVQLRHSTVAPEQLCSGAVEGPASAAADDALQICPPGPAPSIAADACGPVTLDQPPAAAAAAALPATAVAAGRRRCQQQVAPGGQAAMEPAGRDLNSSASLGRLPLVDISNRQQAWSTVAPERKQVECEQQQKCHRLAVPHDAFQSAQQQQGHGQHPKQLLLDPARQKQQQQLAPQCAADSGFDLLALQQLVGEAETAAPEPLKGSEQQTAELQPGNASSSVQQQPSRQGPPQPRQQQHSPLQQRQQQQQAAGMLPSRSTPPSTAPRASVTATAPPPQARSQQGTARATGFAPGAAQDAPTTAQHPSSCPRPVGVGVCTKPLSPAPAAAVAAAADALGSHKHVSGDLCANPSPAAAAAEEEAVVKVAAAAAPGAVAQAATHPAHPSPHCPGSGQAPGGGAGSASRRPSGASSLKRSRGGLGDSSTSGGGSRQRKQVRFADLPKVHEHQAKSDKQWPLADTAAAAAMAAGPTAGEAHAVAAPAAAAAPPSAGTAAPTAAAAGTATAAAAAAAAVAAAIAAPAPRRRSRAAAVTAYAPAPPPPQQRSLTAAAAAPAVNPAAAAAPPPPPQEGSVVAAVAATAVAPAPPPSAPQRGNIWSSQQPAILTLEELLQRQKPGQKAGAGGPTTAAGPRWPQQQGKQQQQQQGKQQQQEGLVGEGPLVEREMLQQGRVLAQVDSKLLLVAVGSRLLLVDQHAADERVQLEALQDQLAAEQQQTQQQRQQQASQHGQEQVQQQQQQQEEGEGWSTGAGQQQAATKPPHLRQPTAAQQMSPIPAAPRAPTPLLQSVKPSKPLTVHLSAQEAAAATRCQQQLAAWGWNLAATEAPAPGPSGRTGSTVSASAAAGKAGAISSGSGDKHSATSSSSSQGGGSKVVLLQRVPVLVGVMLAGADLQLYLHQLMETGVTSAPPPGVLRVLRSKACRSAIMFGQQLSLAAGQRLLQQLCACRLYWCCAHGRPTAVPLLDAQQYRAARQAGQQ